MKRLMLHIFGLLCVVHLHAQQLVFSSIGTSEGLSADYVFQMGQWRDGRLAVVTVAGIDVWDGHSFQHLAQNNTEATPIRGYRGATHLYADKENRLWVKDYGRVWCFDEQLTLEKNNLPDDADDVFVDDQGEIYFVQQDSLDMLFDLKRMGGKLYRFYASGTVTCSEEGHELYTSTAGMLDSTARTSLVVADTLREKFYQLVDGRLCLEFDTHTRTWTELFRSEKLHTIALIDPNTAFIVSHDGLWRLDLPSRKAEQMDQVEMADGSHLSSSRINTVFTDQEGTVWLGTYDHGLLRGTWHTPWYQTGWAYAGYLLAALGLLLIVFIIHRTLVRIQQRKEQLLLQRIQQLIIQADTQKEQRLLEGTAHEDLTSKEEDQTSTFSSTESNLKPQPLARRSQTSNLKPQEHAELMNRAILLVEQHLATPGYSVERLAQDLCMDRTGLYKKMKEAIEQTPTAFIRHIRLTHAAQYIREGNMTMNEIAERTGFSSSSYMARCFQEEWGKKPSQLRQA